MIIEYNITDICEVWALNKDLFGFSLHQPGHILRCHKDHWPQSTSRPQRSKVTMVKPVEVGTNQRFSVLSACIAADVPA